MRLSVGELAKALIFLPVVVCLVTACEHTPKSATAVMMATGSPPPPRLEGSLFPSDQAVLGDEAIQRILSSKLELPQKARLAVMKFSAEGHYWGQEDYGKTQEEFAQVLTTGLLASKRIAGVTPLPSLMIPKQPSIPLLREAAVRMQSDLLLVYRLTSDVYSREAIFSKDRVKAFGTCEAVLLDVRTGLVPFTRIVTREQSAQKKPSDLVFEETIQRAEKEASLLSLKAVADEMVAFLGSLPQ